MANIQFTNALCNTRKIIFQTLGKIKYSNKHQTYYVYICEQIAAGTGIRLDSVLGGVNRIENAPRTLRHSAVSYTHLDVYKRQPQNRTQFLYLKRSTIP